MVHAHLVSTCFHYASEGSVSGSAVPFAITEVFLACF